MIKIIFILIFIIISGCSKKAIESVNHESYDDNDFMIKDDNAKANKDLEYGKKLSNNDLINLANEILSKDVINDEEKISKPAYKDKLRTLNTNILKSYRNAGDYADILNLYRKNILCGDYRSDCSGTKLFHLGCFTQDILLKIIKEDLNDQDTTSEIMLNAFYLAYEKINIKEKNNLDRLFVKNYPTIKKNINKSSKIQSVLDKRLWIVADRIGRNIEVPEDLASLITEYGPWMYSNRFQQDHKNLKKAFYKKWIDSIPKASQYKEALTNDNRSIVSLLKLVSPQVKSNFHIKEIKYNKCYYLLDRAYRKHNLSHFSKILSNSMNINEKNECLSDFENYLKARILTTIKSSNQILIKIIEKIKEEKFSNIKIFTVIKSRLGPLKTYWQNELENFKTLEDLLHTEFLTADKEKFEFLKLCFEELGERFQMYAQYPAMLSLLYHFKDMISSHIAIGLKIKETTIAQRLENLLLGSEWPILNFGLESFGVDKILNQTKIIYSFYSGLMTDSFNDLKTPPKKIIEFILDKFPDREYKHISSQVERNRRFSYKSHYKEIAYFCEKEAENFLDTKKTNYKFKKNLSDLNKNLLFDVNNAFVINSSLIDQTSKTIEFAKIDYERKLRFGRLLVQSYNQFANDRNNIKKISKELYNKWFKKHNILQKQVLGESQAYLNKTYSCIYNLSKIKKSVTYDFLNREYLFLEEVHHQMTLLRDLKNDDLTQANKITQLGLEDVQLKDTLYLNKNNFTYSKFAFLLRLKHYLTKKTNIGINTFAPILTKLSIENDFDNISEKDKTININIPYHPNKNIFIREAMKQIKSNQSNISFLDWWTGDASRYVLANKTNKYLQLYKVNIINYKNTINENFVIDKVLENYQLLKISERKNIYNLSEKDLYELIGLELFNNVQNEYNNFMGINLNHFISKDQDHAFNMFDKPMEYFFEFVIGNTLISEQKADEVAKADEFDTVTSIYVKNQSNYNEGHNYFRDKNSMGPLIFSELSGINTILDNEFIRIIKFEFDKFHNIYKIINDTEFMNKELKKYDLFEDDLLIKHTEHESLYVPKELINNELSVRLEEYYTELLENISEVIKDPELISKLNE